MVMLDGMETLISTQKRQLNPLDLLAPCQYASWEEYNWRDIVQCNALNSGLKIAWNPAVYCIIASCHAVSMFMALQLIVQTISRFRKWNTLYPWTIIFAALGIIGEIVSIDLTIWVLRPVRKDWAVLHTISQILCFTGFAFVLYSRLQFVIPTKHKRLQRALLFMVLFNAVAFHVPVMASTIVSAYGDPLLGYNLYNHVVYTEIGFAGQEVLLSSVYIYFLWQYLQASPKDTPDPVKKQERVTFQLVVLAYTTVLITDVLTLVLLGKDVLLGRYTVLGLVLTLKLNVEYFVLNKLVETTQRRTEILERGNISSGGRTICTGVANGDFLTSAIPETSHEPQQQNESASKDQNLHIIEHQQLESRGTITRNGMDDLERQYLGQWRAS